MAWGQLFIISDRHPITIILSLFGLSSLRYFTNFGASLFKYGTKLSPKALETEIKTSVEFPRIISSWSKSSSSESDWLLLPSYEFWAEWAFLVT